MMRLSLAKRVSILSLCLIGFSLPWTAFSVSPVQANLEPTAIAIGDPVREEKQARQLVEWLGTKQYDKVTKTPLDCRKTAKGLGKPSH